jgi:hypothetical protein
MVNRTRHHEQQIGEPVDIPDQDLVDRRPQRHHAPLRTPADRPRHVQRGTGLDAAGEDKMRERGEIGLEPIDQLLEALDIAVMKHRLGDAGGDPFGGIGEPGANRKEIALDLDERVADIGEPRAVGTTADRCEREAEKGVQLVDLAVRVDAEVALRDTAAVKERCLTGVASARIDFHDLRDGLFII